ncbi:hypothetical protein NPIL_319431 [Nephila pilipes]|uniref:Uncharacterized protein n=1 Tax=Nephila pilipes TaxID=299642 RepID=A0A8X6T9I2_NEPPI|nr:hypothetical protein NPIL_319431 [Nephila pilipes]
MQISVFGWVTSGSLEEVILLNKVHCCVIRDNEVDGNLRQVWEPKSIGIKYEDFNNSEEDQGIIERVEETNEQQVVSNNPVYYLPHRAVYKQDRLIIETQIMFDASSLDSGQLPLNE